MEKLYLFIIFISICSNLFLLKQIRTLKKENISHKLFFKKVINCVNSVRYGKLSVRLKETTNIQFKEISESINRMIETLADREGMINEYQKVMLEKNHSLESLIKKEHELHQLRKDFVATVGHDLKVPIIAESNTIEFLLDGYFGDLNEKQFEALTKMQGSNKELIELVENLLETYKTQEHLITLEKTLVNVNSLLEEVAKEMRQVAVKNNQEILVTLPTESNEINIDPFQIKRVVKNLLLNSISFAPKNSRIIISLSQNTDKIKITVTDFGVGIEKEDLEHIFEKYYSCAKKFRKVGTGLGLYLSKEIITAHNGTIEVSSTPYEKTEFTILLPKSN